MPSKKLEIDWAMHDYQYKYMQKDRMQNLGIKWVDELEYMKYFNRSDSKVNTNMKKRVIDEEVSTTCWLPSLLCLVLFALST